MGNMSIQEYSKHRRYADAFPTLDTDALQKRLDEMIQDEETEMEDSDGN